VPYTEPDSDLIPPVVIQRTPEAGERLSPTGEIELVFDRAMDQPSVASAFQLQPSVAGTVTWPDDRTMVFRPGSALPLDTTFDAALTQRARAADGAPLAQPYQFRFVTQGNLEVGQTIPAAQAQEVDPNTIVTVLFNRPVVPLTTLSQQAALPQPLSFTPLIEGQAEWLNTSVLVFRPARPLPGGTAFEAQVAADLRDIDGNPLAADYRWSFSTAAPKVAFVTPSDAGSEPAPDGPLPVPRRPPGPAGRQGGLARVDTAITARFNQPIDPASAQAAFSLTSERIGASPIAGALAVLTDTLIFTPSAPLAFDERYVGRIAAGVLSASGGTGSREPFEWRFATVPLPGILGTDPADGESSADPYTAFTIRFNTEIDPATVMPHLSMTPALSPTQVFTYYNTWDHSFVLNFGVAPATDYEVRIDPGISDPYGNRIQQPHTVRFRTRDADPFVTLDLPYGGATLNAYLPARVVASTINVSQLDFELYGLPADGNSFLPQYVYDPNATIPGQTLVRRWSRPITGQRNTQVRTLIDLAETGGVLAPGLFLLRVASPDLPSDREPQRILLSISELNLVLKSDPTRSFAWAADLNTGLPVSGLPIDFYRIEFSNGRPMVTPIGGGTTDDNGVVQVDRHVEPGSTANYGSTVAIARNRFSAISSEWANGIRPFDLGLGFPMAYEPSTPLRAFIYTDRPIYRPGQTAFVRGLVRAQDDFAYSLPVQGTAARVTVRDASGEPVFDQALPLDAFGAFAFEVSFDEGAPLGTYQIEANFEQRGSAYSSFTVAAYRPPEYEVAVTPSATETVRGATITAQVGANYLSGGGVPNAPVQWNVLASATWFDPPELDDYTFSDLDDPWMCFDCWWVRRDSAPPQPLASGEGTTNERGEFTLTFPISTELRDSAGTMISGPVSLSIEANVSGADSQTIAGRASATVHPAEWYAGIALEENLLRASRPATIELVAVDWHGARLGGQAIDVEVYRREWQNTFVPSDFGGRWTSAFSDTLIATLPAMSDAQGRARVTFTPQDAGTYKIVAQGRDASGRQVRSGRFAWATGPGYVPWLRENNDKINLVANKTTFVPGEVAQILIPSPFIDRVTTEHYALVTVERGHVRRHQVIRISGSSQVFPLPITGEDAPNIYVSAVLFKGMTPPSGGEGESGPDQKLGYIGLRVEPMEQVFNIALTPDRDIAQPGESVTYAIRATDSDGQPVSAQFSLDLVDKGILNLMPRTEGEIVQAFWGPAPLAVQTASGLSVSANRATDELARQSRIPATGGGYGGAVPAAPAPAEAPMADALESKARMAGPDQAAPAVRENFADTGFWAPAITTDASGQAIVTIELPDNLTTWVLRAVGIDPATRVGESDVNVVATKPLLIRPVAPRFLVVNDVVELGAIVNNNTGAPQTAVVTLDAGGMVISPTTPAEQEVSIPAGGETRVTWLAQATDAAQADLIFSVQNSQYSDASKPRLSTAPNGGLRINRYSAPEVVGTAGDLAGEGARTEVIGLPPDLDTTQGRLTVRLDPSLAAPMQDGLRALEDNPYESSEGVTSRFLPNVLTYRALRELGIDDPELAARLPELVRSSLDKLVALQRADGGWGWWRDDESNPNISAYVVLGMLRAREAGFDVSSEPLDRGLQYLQAQTRALDERSASIALDWQTYLQYVLGDAGRADPARLDNLFALRANLSNYARALLIMALGKRDPGDARLKTLFADLNARAVQSATGAHWEERTIDWWAMNTDTRSTAMVLDAIALHDPTNALAPNVVRWLMMARQEGTGYWRGSQETVWSLIALTDWMRATGELKGDYPYSARLNDQVLAEGVASAATITRSTVVETPIAELLRDTGNRLSIARGPGQGRLYYTAHLNAYLPVPSVRAADRGITVLRRYVSADCTDGAACPEVTSARLGETIRVELTIIAPSDLYYLRVADPLPAGAEAVDVNLATTSQLAAGPALQREGQEENPYWWWWRWYSRNEVRDDRVVLFASFLSKGTYEYSYTVRATSPGQFNVIPAFANLDYFPEVFGRSDGALFTVKR
jgi:uncharacterized protein YfaS (alpha-2-macroglobulin family)